jgi:hypothetical protein
MQTAGAGGSNSVFGMLSQTFAKEGIRGIYRGASAPLASISFIFAVCFCKYIFLYRGAITPTLLSIPSYFVIGLFYFCIPYMYLY